MSRLDSRHLQNPGIKVGRSGVDEFSVSFESEDIPDWVREGFDARTTLPHGPLEDFPIPLEGSITGARSLLPKSGEPARYIVTAASADSVADTLTFYDEYLPLAGYFVVAAGSMHSARRFLARGRRPASELIVFRRPPFIGTLLLRPPHDRDHGTQIEVDVAHCHHPEMRDVADTDRLRGNRDVIWRMFRD